MSRHVDFRHHGHSALCGIAYEFAYLIVGIIFTLIASLALVLRIIQLGMAAALDAPRRIVGKMPVEEVELVARHEVYGLLEHGERLIIAARVMHEATHRIGRPVVDLGIRYTPVTVRELIEGLTRPEKVASHHSPALADYETVLIRSMCGHEMPVDLCRAQTVCRSPFNMAAPWCRDQRICIGRPAGGEADHGTSFRQH